MFPIQDQNPVAENCTIGLFEESDTYKLTIGVSTISSLEWGN
jgi:hypothetical protein